MGTVVSMADNIFAAKTLDPSNLFKLFLWTGKVAKVNFELEAADSKTNAFHRDGNAAFHPGYLFTGAFRFSQHLV